MPLRIAYNDKSSSFKLLDRDSSVSPLIAPLTIITKCSILDVAAVLDPPLVLATEVCKSMHKILPVIMQENFKTCDSKYNFQIHTLYMSFNRHIFQISLFVHKNKALNLQFILFQKIMYLVPYNFDFSEPDKNIAQKVKFSIKDFFRFLLRLLINWLNFLYIFWLPDI